VTKCFEISEAIGTMPEMMLTFRPHMASFWENASVDTGPCYKCFMDTATLELPFLLDL